MSRSRPGSRPVSRSNSISDGQTGHHFHQHERADGQPVALYGPGFNSAPVHSVGGDRVVLVTPEMMALLQSGQMPTTQALNRNATRTQVGEISHIPTLEKGATGAGISEISDIKSTGELVEAPLELDAAPEGGANPLARFRYRYREYLAEFIGTMVLIIFGNGVNCQVVLSKFTQGSYLSISHGWGAGVMFGVYIAGGISGAHINPVVTISLAVFRGFPWRKLPGYALAQLLGAMVGSILIQANYKNDIDQYEGGAGIRTMSGPNATATLFFTAAQPYMTNVSAFFSEFGATAVLLAVILCMGDANNNPCPPGLNGLILFYLILAIGAALGTQTAYCLNPARDLGPRLAATMFGYPAHEIWTYRNCYWIWCVCIATTCGGLVGCLVYDTFIFQGESPLNKAWELPWSTRGKELKARKEAGQA